MNERDLLVQTLRNAIVLLRGLAAGIPEDRLDVVRKAGAWSLKRHFHHLAVVQPVLLERLVRFTAEECPRFAPYVPAANDPAAAESTVAEALERFAECRSQQVRLIESVDEQVWQRTGVHEEYLHYSFLILVRHIAMHDCWHMYRMEELWLVNDASLTDL
jgi:hypothetical protein